MKKQILFIILAFILILAVVLIGVANNREKINEISQFNSLFEKYKGQTLYGADVLTIINKAIDNNKTYAIAQDNKGYFIDDGKFTLKVELILLAKNEEEKIVENTYQMEDIERVGLTEFISSFGLTNFKCENIEYNSENRVNKIALKQQEL